MLTCLRWSIVNKLGGKISVRSELGKGTDIDVNIPIDRKNYVAPDELSLEATANASANAREYLSTIREMARGKKLSISRRKLDATRYTDVSCLRKYCSQWFGFLIEDVAADIVVTDYYDESLYQEGQRILLVYDDIAYIGRRESTKRGRHVVANICQPISPFKLARALISLMEQEIPPPPAENGEPGKLGSGTSVGTQTPLGSPEERTILNGIILSDYGFTPQINPTIVGAEATHEQIDNSKAKFRTSSPKHQAEFAQKLSGLEELSRLTLVDPKTRSLEDKRKQAIIEPTKESAAPAASETPTPSKGGLHILAVDDNALNLQLLTRYLSKRKEDTIEVARNGVEAVEAVRNLGPGDRFDCIFMDISMPIMDGFEATRQIRIHERSLMRCSSLQDVKIVLDDQELVSTNNAGVQEQARAGYGYGDRRMYIAALTGLASRKHRDEADDSGFDDYLTKPTPFGKIAVLLKRLSEEKVVRLQEMGDG